MTNLMINSVTYGLREKKLRRRQAPTIGNAFSHKIDLITLFLGNSRSQKTSKLHYWLKSYSIFSEKSDFFLLEKVMKLVGGGSVINRAYPV